MRRGALLAILLIAFVALFPVVCSIEAETWTEGLFDAETDDVVPAARFALAAMDAIPLPVVRPVQRIIAVVGLVDEVAQTQPAFATPGPRAPPAL